ncbi:MAG TPA: PHP domain-containing protein, partial [Chloroflexia bacterium]|nr:PHP domain-containing protein [Chloroflexia bacterium]
MSLPAYLHVHTHFSPGGGPASPEQWCDRAAELGYSVLGVTDRSPMAGFPRLHEAARKAGITPLFGMELDLLLPGSARGSTITQPVALFVCEPDGFSSLAQIAAAAFAGWPAQETPLPLETLSRYAQGLVLLILGGDEAGALSPFVTLPQKKQAELSDLMRAAFGERFFLGVPHAGQPGDNALAGQITQAALAAGIAPLALPSARYLAPEGAPAYEALRLARQQAGWPRSTDNASTSSVAAARPGSQYLRSPEDAGQLFQAQPEALANTGRLVELCSGAQLQAWREQTTSPAAEPLKQLASRNLLTLLGTGTLPGEIEQRLDAEVALSEANGHTAAWFALASICNEARAQRIPLGAPRGAADGSLLAYALGASHLNPMAYPP